VPDESLEASMLPEIVRPARRLRRWDAEPSEVSLKRKGERQRPTISPADLRLDAAHRLGGCHRMALEFRLIRIPHDAYPFLCASTPLLPQLRSARTVGFRLP